MLNNTSEQTALKSLLVAEIFSSELVIEHLFKQLKLFLVQKPELLIELQSLLSNSLNNEAQNLTSVANAPIYYTRKQICQILSINQSTLWRWTKELGIETHVVGNRVYYTPEALERFMKKHMTKF